MKVLIEREATQEESKAIEQAIVVLAEAGLELIGTRPKDREWK